MSQTGGWKIQVREHSLSIDVYLLLNAAICDSTTAQKIDIKRLALAVIRQMDNSYQISYYKDVVESVHNKSGLDHFRSRNFDRVVKKFVQVHCTVKTRFIKNISLRHNNELLIDVQNKEHLPTYYGAASFIGSRDVALNELYVPNMINGSDNNTIPHELGHTLGLHHVDDWDTKFFSPREGWYKKEKDANRTNVMFSGDGGYINDKTSTRVIPLQIDLIIERYRNGNLNLM